MTGSFKSTIAHVWDTLEAAGNRFLPAASRSTRTFGAAARIGEL